MEFDLQWLLIGLPVVFALGWIASRLEQRQQRRDSQAAPRHYFKGLNLLLNEQHDQAIDAFIEAVQGDAETTELHFALGNLFRRRGEFERAVRVHEHLLKRGDLKAEQRHRAQFALAQDFMKAGLFDRAEAAFASLDGSAHEADAQLALLSLHERAHDWPAALAVAQRLGQRGEASFAERMAHHWCELALAAQARGDTAAANHALAQARMLAPDAARPLLEQGAHLARHGEHAAALANWDELAQRHPGAFDLIAVDYATSARAAGALAQASAQEVLMQGLQRQPTVALLRAINALQGTQSETRWAAFLSTHASLAAAAELLVIPASQWQATTQGVLHSAIQRAGQPLQTFSCAACGFEARQYYWQCPGCLNWDSYPTQRGGEAAA